MLIWNLGTHFKQICIEVPNFTFTKTYVSLVCEMTAILLKPRFANAVDIFLRTYDIIWSIKGHSKALIAEYLQKIHV